MAIPAIGKMTCPRCQTAMETVRIKYGVVFSCRSCKGRAIGIGLLKKISDTAAIQQIWAQAKEENRLGPTACPGCRLPMRVMRAGFELDSVELDLCPVCFIIWFDRDELARLPRVSDEEVARRTAPRLAQPPMSSGFLGAPPYEGLGLVELLISLLRWIS